MGGRPLDDRELVERAKRGDVDAFAELVRRYQGIALRAAYVIAGSRGEAEDAAQEAFVKAYNALDRFRGGAPFRPWLLTIVANEARNRVRRSKRQEDLALRAGTERPSGDAAPSPEVSALESEERRLLLEAVNRLRPEDREVVAMRFFLDLSESEMATVIGRPRGTVKSRLSRAMKRLRADVARGPLGDVFSTGGDRS